MSSVITNGIKNKEDHSLLEENGNGLLDHRFQDGDCGDGQNLDQQDSVDIEFEKKSEEALIYRVNDNPPLRLTLAFAIQHILLVFASPLSMTMILAEIACLQDDENLKVQIISSIMFVVGLSTFLMTTIGLGLPVFQGPAITYLAPLLAMKGFEEWKCPATFIEIDPITNTSTLMAIINNSTIIPARQHGQEILGALSGSLIAAGAVHFLIGITGVVGFLCRFIGPVTIVPTILLVGLSLSNFIIKFMEPSPTIGFTVAVFNLLFALLLGDKRTPIPFWNKTKGFHIHWSRVHTLFPILLSMLIGWTLTAILTASGYFSDDPSQVEFKARSDARNQIIGQNDWFIFPYPGKFASPTFNTGIFINFMIATLMSVLDSIGDYAATAKTARVPPPPQFSFNRGIAVEGVMSCLAGALGCGLATVSYGTNIGAMRLTRVVSRRVFQAIGIIFILLSMLGKVAAILMTIPHPVLGGTMLVVSGIFIGVVISYLSTVDLSSTRNVAIIGNALLLGVTLPSWIAKNNSLITTGNPDIDVIIQMLLSNPTFIGGLFAFVMDNLVSGTLKERGLVSQLKDLDDNEAKEMAQWYEDGPEVYRLPFIPLSFRRSRFAKYVPIFYYESFTGTKESQNC